MPVVAAWDVVEAQSHGGKLRLAQYAGLPQSVRAAGFRAISTLLGLADADGPESVARFADVSAAFRPAA